MMKATKLIDLSRRIFKRKFDNQQYEGNITFDFNRPFIVVRDDGKLIQQFTSFYEASVFSVKLNTSYEDNGIKSKSKVVTLSM